jgi:tRNA nucleotidyltransferase (CCA-adding enzyme)
MKQYLVGGAVRDKLMGLEAKERDWLVVGATPDDMLANGYRPVGKDFPVFLHPVTGEEYALARTERKTAPGYHGFVFHADSTVTVEEDLLRRDLTVNAIAQDAEGVLVDPFGGCADIERKLLRHVSPAFAEDPVRILRVARFAARWHHLGYTIATDTMTLMCNMVAAGEVNALVAERVWQECERALGEQNPQVFFHVLRECGALAVIFPEVDMLFGVPQSPQHHPEIDTGVHTLMALQQCAHLTEDKLARFAVVCHDLGKGLTPKAEWPRHIAHEHRSERLVRALCERLGVPTEFRELALKVALYHTHAHRALELRAATVVELFQNLDLFRRPQRLQSFLSACEADARGRTGFEQRDYPQANYLSALWQACADVRSDGIDVEQFKGKCFGEELHRLRVVTVKQAIKLCAPERLQ